MPIPKYNIKRDLTPPSKVGVCSVRLRVTSQSRRVDLHTGITVTPKQWNSDRVKQGCVVNGVEYHIINDLLRKQEDFFYIALLTSHSDLKAMQPYVQLHSKGKDRVIDAIDAAFDGK